MSRYLIHFTYTEIGILLPRNYTLSAFLDFPDSSTGSPALPVIPSPRITTGVYGFFGNACLLLLVNTGILTLELLLEYFIFLKMYAGTRGITGILFYFLEGYFYENLPEFFLLRTMDLR